MKIGRLAATATLGLAGWAAGAGFAAAPAAAAPCAPGAASCPPSPLTVSPSATLLAHTSGTITAPGSFNADYDEWIYQDPSNEFCSNCLDWVVKIHNQSGSAESLERVTVSNFSSFQVDIGYDTSNSAPGGASGGTQMPSDVNRSADGRVVGWDFRGSTPKEINPGETTVLLEAETNAHNYDFRGLISSQDGGANQAQGYEPAGEPGNGVPDAPWVPGIGLIGGVAAGGFAFRRRFLPKTATSN